MCGRRLAPAAAKKDIKDDTTVHRSAVVLTEQESADQYSTRQGEEEKSKEKPKPGLVRRCFSGLQASAQRGQLSRILDNRIIKLLKGTCWDVFREVPVHGWLPQ
jgi:hypothetical protein